MQEMTGGKPEGGGERSTSSCSTYEGSCKSTKTPQCLFFTVPAGNEPLSAHSSTQCRVVTLRSGSPSWIR